MGGKRSPSIKLYNENKDKIHLLNPLNLKWWDRYEADMNFRALSEKTIYNYKSDVFQWFFYVFENQGNVPVIELNEDDVEEFFFYCNKNGNSTKRIKRRMAAVSAFYRFLRKKKIANNNPVDFLDRPQKDTPITTQTYLTREDVANMRIKLTENVEKAETLYQKEKALELRLYAMLSLSTMARVNAIRNIRWDMIDFDNRIVKDVVEKEQKVVDLFFSKEVKELFIELKAFRRENGIKDGGLVFYSRDIRDGRKHHPISATTLNSWCKRIGKMIGYPSLHPHDFRHSGATLLKNAGMTLEDISSLLNHAGTDVTNKYYIKEDKKKIQAIKDQFEI